MGHRWIPTFSFNFLKSLGIDCNLYYFPPRAQPPYFLSFTSWFSSYFQGKYRRKRISAPFCLKIIFISSCLNRNFLESTPICTVEQKKHLLPLLCWELGKSIFFLLFVVSAPFCLLGLEITLGL